VNARLRPLREDEFDAWYATVEAGHAESGLYESLGDRELAVWMAKDL
jgi:hypothetical protein